MNVKYTDVYLLQKILMLNLKLQGTYILLIKNFFTKIH